MRRIFAAVALLPFALLAAVVPAHAAKPAPPAYSIALDQAAPALGDVVTVTTTGADSLRRPVVQWSCFQSGVKVWGYNGAPSESVRLGSDWSPWLAAGGPADCTAALYDMSWRGGQQSSTLYAEFAFYAEG